MKRRLLIDISLTLNAALVVAIFLSARKPSPPGNFVPAIAPVVAAVPTPAAPQTSPPDSGLPFQWDQIASPDPKIYRDNLRALGCPELTVREIIRAVINESFRPRRQAVLASFQDHYWDLVLRRQLIRRQWMPRSEWGQELASLAGEREKLLTDILGPEGLPAPDSRQTPRADLEQRLAWLSPEKREALIELEEKHQQSLREWTTSLGSRLNAPRTAEDEAQLQKVEQEFKASEARLLTPEELAKLSLSESNVAGWAASLPGFNPTEEQWQTLTELREHYEDSKAAWPPPACRARTRQVNCRIALTMPSRMRWTRTASPNINWPATISTRHSNASQRDTDCRTAWRPRRLTRNKPRRLKRTRLGPTQTCPRKINRPP